MGGPAQLRSRWNRIAKLLTIFSSLSFAAITFAQEIVTLSARPEIVQSYFLASLPTSPQAIAVLFSGSGGFIRLRQEQEKIKFGNNNFLVRSRGEFIKRGIIAAIVDAPSDQQRGWGMADEFRMSEQHFTDLAAVVADLQRRFAKIPIFLVGTSRGTISAAALAARFGPQISGAILTATMFRQTGRKSREPGPGLSRFDFATIKVPLLFVHHVNDQCSVTPYADAARLVDKYPLISVFGGRAAESEPCDPFSAHGFYGKESETIEQIVNWMLKRPFLGEVK
ncbi:MAG TPA: alpha/beta hydrolase [Candidatus Binatia bacterium]|nr:alpha/beta hydrolase [Candidatus Binatia bacterium]